MEPRTEALYPNTIASLGFFFYRLISNKRRLEFATPERQQLKGIQKINTDQHAGQSLILVPPILELIFLKILSYRTEQGSYI